ncbi:hypothetical protein [Acanthopleuribacter pedis]|uniref:Uncharacterized protein n=1 Tax=Acanthopleuribacter pedis TaxID=442870 RepID=A0A8J7U728_9BACT|nr:hypothetical protein [Acanthopleuribacter pedis]MBO1322559.1 hypothetical protein [Acanthopleuribacter pedis]
MDGWAAFVARLNFLRMPHDIDQAMLYPYLEEDEGPKLARVDFFGNEQIREAWDVDEYQPMLKEKAFIIGHVNLLDEYVFATTNLNAGIAIIHHDDVFPSKDSDALVANELPYFDCSLEGLFRALLPRGKD